MPYKSKYHCRIQDSAALPILSLNSFHRKCGSFKFGRKYIEGFCVLYTARPALYWPHTDCMTVWRQQGSLVNNFYYSLRVSGGGGRRRRRCQIITEINLSSRKWWPCHANLVTGHTVWHRTAASCGSAGTLSRKPRARRTECDTELQLSITWKPVDKMF